MKFKPLNEKILVKVATDEEVTEGGIILTSAKQERKYEGTVIDIGTNPDIKKFGVKVGTYVVYPKGLNTPIEIDGEEYDIVSIYDICGASTEEE